MTSSRKCPKWWEYEVCAKVPKSRPIVWHEFKFSQTSFYCSNPYWCEPILCFWRITEKKKPSFADGGQTARALSTEYCDVIFVTNCGLCVHWFIKLFASFFLSFSLSQGVIYLQWLAHKTKQKTKQKTNAHIYAHRQDRMDSTVYTEIISSKLLTASDHNCLRPVLNIAFLSHPINALLVSSNTTFRTICIEFYATAMRHLKQA